MCGLHKLDYLSPIGVIQIEGTKDAILSIKFSKQELPENGLRDETPRVLQDCSKQLDEYFKSARKEFSFPYLLDGSDFQKTVWKAITNISFAEKASYKDIAALIGNEKAIRAVGSANGKNKLMIVVPCHRIIGSNGKLTGYSGGLWRKEWLLHHENSLIKFGHKTTDRPIGFFESTCK